MRTIARPVIVSPLGFGRRRRAVAAAQSRPMVSNDVRLFLWTFAAGFLSISLFLA
jgi:hypothetical protein